jgi:hypothetical protein
MAETSGKASLLPTLANFKLTTSAEKAHHTPVLPVEAPRELLLTNSRWLSGGFLGYYVRAEADSRYIRP